MIGIGIKKITAFNYYTGEEIVKIDTEKKASSVQSRSSNGI